MKFREKEIKRWERWKEKAQLPLFLLAFVLYFALGLVFLLFESTRFLGVGWGFLVGMIMGIYFCAVDRYRQIEYGKLKSEQGGGINSDSLRSST